MSAERNLESGYANGLRCGKWRRAIADGEQTNSREGEGRNREIHEIRERVWGMTSALPHQQRPMNAKKSGLIGGFAKWPGRGKIW